ncbi:MAG: helix-turn-helix transcriptional regulator [Bryobacteraceae bacterium]
MDFHRLQSRLLTEVRARVRNGEMTERGLARLAGLSQPHIHNVLKGARSLSLEASDRILRRLGVDMADLMANEAGPASQPSGASCRMVPFLYGLLGPGYPFPETLGGASYPFPAAEVDHLADPVAVRLEPQADAFPLFAGNTVLLLERSAVLPLDPHADGYFALDLWGIGAIGLIRDENGICLWNPRGAWEPAGLAGAQAAGLIRARVKLVVRHL